MMLSSIKSVQHNHIKILFKAIVVFIGCFFATQISAAQRDYTLNINPTSGPPGTTVALTTNPSYSDEQCFANGQPLNGLSYTVPADASGTVNFHCGAGTGQNMVRTNLVSFTITPPAPDTDGDGIPDSQDSCPSQYAQTNDGCPAANNENPPNNPPPDTSPEIPPQATTPPPSNDVTLPDLPNDGACYIATRANVFVNVRHLPTTESEIIATLDPSQTYPASGHFEIGDMTWYWAADFGGWVSGAVTRQTGVCSETPIGTPDGNIDFEQTQLIDGELINAFSVLFLPLNSVIVDLPLNIDVLRLMYNGWVPQLFLTPEIRLTFFLTHGCGFAWEDSEFVVMILSEDGYLEYFVDNILVSPDEICDVAQDILDALEN